MARSPCHIWMNGSLGLADSRGRARPGWAGSAAAGPSCRSLPLCVGREGGAASSHVPQLEPGLLQKKRGYMWYTWNKTRLSKVNVRSMLFGRGGQKPRRCWSLDFGKQTNKYTNKARKKSRQLLWDGSVFL